MLLLDASKAFDRIEYVRLFTLLRLRNMCPLVLRLVMNMYISQRIQVIFGTVVTDLIMRTNNLMADFSNAHSSTLSVLYNSYCMNVYGFQLWCFNDYKSVERMAHGEKQLEEIGQFGKLINEHIMS